MDQKELIHSFTPEESFTKDDSDLTAQRERLRAVERDINTHLDALFSYARRIREPREQDWSVNIRLLRGEYIGPPLPPGFQVRKINNIWRIVHLLTAKVTDTRPKPEVVAKDSSLADIARTLRRLIDGIFYLNDLDRHVKQISDDIQVYGIAFSKVVWDPDAQWNQGDVVIVRVDPRHVYLDHAQSLDEMSFILYRAPVPLAHIRKRYPLRGHEVQPDATISTPGDFGTVPIGPILPLEQRYGLGIPKAWLEEWWIKDPSVGADGEPLYPNGRVIVRANGVILADGPNPYKDPWPGPWVEYRGTDDPDSPWPIPDVNQYRDIQSAMDRVTHLIESSAALSVGGIWIADPQAIDPSILESREYLYPKPGRVIIKKAMGHQLTRDPGVPIAKDLIDYLMTLIRTMDGIAGLLDQPAQKVPGGGVTAQGALEIMRAGSEAFTRLRARTIESGLTRMGQWTLNRILQFYTEDRVAYVIGSSPNKLEPINFSIAAVAARSGGYEEMFRSYRFYMVPGSSLALTREREYAAHMALYGMGAIDRQALLENLDYPKWEEVLERMRQAETTAIPAARARGGPAPRGRGATVARQVMRTLTNPVVGGGG